MTPEKQVQNKIVGFLKTLPDCFVERRNAGGFGYHAGECQLSKSAFVERYVSPTVKHANSGWNGVEYAVYSNGEEYVFFLDDNYDRCRGICVTADSKQAIATDVFDNID